MSVEELEAYVDSQFDELHRLVRLEEKRTLHLVDLKEAFLTASAAEKIAEINVETERLQEEMANITNQLCILEEAEGGSPAVIAKALVAAPGPSHKVQVSRASMIISVLRQNLSLYNQNGKKQYFPPIPELDSDAVVRFAVLGNIQAAGTKGVAQCSWQLPCPQQPSQPVQKLSISVLSLRMRNKILDSGRQNQNFHAEKFPLAPICFVAGRMRSSGHGKLCRHFKGNIPSSFFTFFSLLPQPRILSSRHVFLMTVAPAA